MSGGLVGDGSCCRCMLCSEQVSQARDLLIRACDESDSLFVCRDVSEDGLLVFPSAVRGDGGVLFKLGDGDGRGDGGGFFRRGDGYGLFSGVRGNGGSLFRRGDGDGRGNGGGLFRRGDGDGLCSCGAGA